MDSSLPDTQTAAVIEDPGPHGRIVIRNDVAVSRPGRDEVLVKLECTGLCGSEIRALQGWGKYNCIVGHEGVGIVVEAGENVSQELLNTRVGVKWLYSACGSCSLCQTGLAHNCPQQENTGRTVPGTLQQYVVANAQYVSRIPDGLASDVAAPLLCAGLTMAGAVSSSLGPDERARGLARDWVVVLGSGGGLGHIGVQIAARLHRLRVIAVDTGPAKRALSLQSGAEAFVDFAEGRLEEEVRRLTGEGAHAVIVVSGAREAFQVAPKLVRNHGTIVCVGLPSLDFELPISATVCAARGLTIKGSSVGTEAQMEELFAHVVAGTIKPAVEVFDFEETPRLIEALKEGSIVGRVVVRLPVALQK